MRSILFRGQIVGSVVLWCLAFLFPVFVLHAETVTLNPASVTVDSNGNFSVTVQISGATNVFTVAFDVVFNSSLLRFVGISEGTFFAGCQTSLLAAENPPGTLIVGLSRLGAGCGGVNGAGTLMTLNFQARAGNGTTALSFANNSVCTLTNGDCVFTTGSWTGSSVTIGSGTATPPPNTPPPAPADTTAPAISNVRVTATASNSATIAWSTDEGSTAQVEYGQSQSYGSQTTATLTFGTSHSQLVTGLLPSTTYQYRIRSNDLAGNTGSSANYSFTTGAAQATYVPPPATPPPQTYPTPNPTPAPLLGSQPKFSVNDRVEVNVPSTNVHKMAAILSPLLDIKNRGAKGTVLMGYGVEDGYAWYEIHFDNSVTGYVRATDLQKDGGGTTVTTVPLQGVATTTTTVPAAAGATFVNNDRVETTALVNVRVGAGDYTQLLDVKPKGSKGTVEGSESEGTTIWYKVAFDNSIAGFVQQSLLQKIGVAVIATANSATTPVPGQTATTAGGTVNPALAVPSKIGRGARGPGVARLQNFLIAEGFLKTTATSVFDLATENAVKAFQKQYGLVSSGSPGTTGYGFVGLKTAAKMNSIIAGRSGGVVGSGAIVSGDAEALRKAQIALLEKQIAEITKLVQSLMEQLQTLLAARAR